MEGKRRSVQVKERDESCQKKLNQAELPYSLSLRSLKGTENCGTLQVVSALLPLYESMYYTYFSLSQRNNEYKVFILDI